MSSTDFAPRPPPGRAGKPVTVRTNFFAVTHLPQASLYHYHVTVTPDVTKRMAFLRQLFKLWQDGPTTKSMAATCVYDGRNNIYSATKLPNDRLSFRIAVPPNVEGGGKEQNFTLEMSLVAVLPMEGLFRFLSGRQENMPQEIFQALDIVTRHMAGFKFLGIGSNFYIPENPWKISNGGELWRGIHSSLRPAKDRLLLNIDVTARAFYAPVPVLEFIANVLGKRSVDQLQQKLTARDAERVGRALKGMQVQITHRGAMKRKFRVAGLTTTAANQTMFTLAEGEAEENAQRSVSWYFQSRYAITLRKGFLNCLIVGDPAKKIYLPMEVCDLVKGQRIPNSKLDEKQTADIIKHTCVPPRQREANVRENLVLMDLDPRQGRNPICDAFQFQVDPKMIEVKGRVLNAPTVIYNGSGKAFPNAGAWNMRGVKVFKGATLSAWGVVDFANLGEQGIRPFLKELIATCIDTGMMITQNQPPIQRGDINNIEASLMSMAGGKKLQLILVVLPTTDSQVYGNVKRVSDTTLGIVTQCLQAKNFRNPNKQYCANVCLKMNVKLGGNNATLPKESLSFITSTPTIVFGADVTHPAPGDEMPSICALVASTDQNCLNFASVLTAQSSRVEIISQMEEMIKTLLRAFYAKTKRKPERILFYRDGVSEGQFAQVRDQEILAIRKACHGMDKNYSPPITFVVVQKRHHARFFPLSPGDADRSGNVKAGMVVEQEITHPNMWDWYLLSHGGLQGTSRPTHYQVLVDENRFTSDSLQELTYRMCHTYARATRSVSVCPPAYYAHLLAFRARFHGGVSAKAPAAGTSRTADPVLTFNTPVKESLLHTMYYM